MALKKTQLLDITSVTGIATVGILTVGVTQTAGGVTVSGGTTISGTSNVNVTGIITATSFSGDGSGLSGVGGQLDVTSSLFI